jgi:hypothetical protein
MISSKLKLLNGKIENIEIQIMKRLVRTIIPVENMIIRKGKLMDVEHNIGIGEMTVCNGNILLHNDKSCNIYNIDLQNRKLEFIRNVDYTKANTKLSPYLYYLCHTEPSKEKFKVESVVTVIDHKIVSGIRCDEYEFYHNADNSICVLWNAFYYRFTIGYKCKEYCKEYSRTQDFTKLFPKIAVIQDGDESLVFDTVGCRLVVKSKERVVLAHRGKHLAKNLEKIDCIDVSYLNKCEYYNAETLECFDTVFYTK